MSNDSDQQPDSGDNRVTRRTVNRGLAAGLAGIGAMMLFGSASGSSNSTTVPPSWESASGDVGTESTPFANGWIQNFHAQSVDAASADIIERWNFEPGYTLPVQQVTSDGDYNNEPSVVIAPNGDLLLIYRSGTDHNNSNSGSIVQRRATDWKDGAPTWGAEKTLADSAYDDRNSEVGVDYDDGRIFIHYRQDDSGTSIGQFVLTSTDSGESYTEDEITTSVPSDANLPWGQPVKTSQGWVQLYYDRDYVSTVISTDGGETWSGGSTIIDTSGDSTLDATEPSPEVIPDADGSRDRVVVLGRDLADGGQFYAKSTDGLATATAPTKFDMSIGGSSPRPLSIGQGTMVVSAADRISHTIRHYTIPSEWFWQDPTELLNVDYATLFRGVDGAEREFGYPALFQLGPGAENVAHAWYSEDSGPNDTEIWVGTGAAAMGGKPKPTLLGNLEAFGDGSQDISDSVSAGPLHDDDYVVIEVTTVSAPTGTEELQLTFGNAGAGDYDYLKRDETGTFTQVTSADQFTLLNATAGANDRLVGEWTLKNGGFAGRVALTGKGTSLNRGSYEFLSESQTVGDLAASSYDMTLTLTGEGGSIDFNASVWKVPRRSEL